MINVIAVTSGIIPHFSSTVHVYIRVVISDNGIPDVRISSRNRITVCIDIPGTRDVNLNESSPVPVLGQLRSSVDR